MAESPSPPWEAVLEAAARLQELVPDAVLVGGSAAAHHAAHRVSFGDDHVVADLRQRFDQIPPDTPAEEMPLAAIHDLLDRGDLDDWRPLLRQIERDPDGELAGAVARLVDVYPMYGTSPLLRAWIERCRNRRDSRPLEGAEVCSLADLRLSLGKTQEDVARAMGISQSDSAHPSVSAAKSRSRR